MGAIASEIPTELLNKIFHLLCVKPIDILELQNMRHLDDFPWAAGLVCRQWRHAFVSFPPLWTSLRLFDPLGERSFSGEVIGRLAVYLQRSGEYPLAIDYSIKPRHSLAEKAWKMLLVHSHRWKVAHIELDDLHQLRPLLAYTGNMSALERLTMSHPHNFSFTEPCSVFEVAPRLTQATFPHWQARTSWSLPWSQLTKLVVQMDSLTDIYAGGVAGLLRKLGSIEELHFVTTSVSCGDIGPPHPSPARLEHLRILKVTQPLILSLLDAPMLHELHLIHRGYPDESFGEKATSFIHRSSCRIRRLLLLETNAEDTRLMTHMDSDVEDLHIIQRLNPSGSHVGAVLAGLATHICLPQLRFLTITTPSTPTSVLNIVGGLSKVFELRARNEQPNDNALAPLERVTIRLYSSMDIPHLLSEAVRRWPPIVDVEQVNRLEEWKWDFVLAPI